MCLHQRNTHLDIEVQPFVHGKTVLVQTMGQYLRVPCPLVPTNNYEEHKDQKHYDRYEDGHNHTDVIVLRILVDGFRGDYWMEQNKGRCNELIKCHPADQRQIENCAHPLARDSSSAAWSSAPHPVAMDHHCHCHCCCFPRRPVHSPTPP